MTFKSRGRPIMTTTIKCIERLLNKRSISGCHITQGIMKHEKYA
jgi:hypothetical protein